MNKLGIRFYEFIGHGDIKRIRGQAFPKGQPQPVWDVKVQRLMKRLKYMRETEAPADMAAAITQAAKVMPKPGEVNIPDNWKTLHHKRRIALARRISGQDIGKVAEADQIIEAFAGKPERPAKPAKAPEPEPEPVAGEAFAKPDEEPAGEPEVTADNG